MDQDTFSQIKLDLQRAERIGLGEAIFCAGKSQAQLNAICQQLDPRTSMLFTRLEQEQFAQFADPAKYDYDPVSKTAWLNPAPLEADTEVAIITGGSSDVSVSREAARTLEFYGKPSTLIDDVGVAGLWRLLERLDDIKAHKIIIAVAGMDAALPTVLGGLVGSAIIAVPTSVGYGMVKDGETALQSLLVSCSAGITVTNIDNGFGAACAALRILNQFNQ
ncbi:MAG: nickel pincer cofactor biosynthesis protein LarB [Pseudomonadales bacterium]|jgi:hypothetical protein